MTVRTQQSEYLKCFFTPEERSELSDKLVRAIAIKVEKEEEFKLVKKQFGEDIEAQTLATNRLARRLAGSELTPGKTDERDRCPFPLCVNDANHDGDHEDAMGTKLTGVVQ